mgnify:CR=1 FL=1
MSDIRLSPGGDIDLTNGSLNLVDGVDAVTQLLNQRLKFFYGEWFLNLDSGIPYFEKVFQKNPNPSVLDSLFKRVILGTPGILRLLEFQMTLDTTKRTLAVKGKAVSTTGNVNFNIGELGA